MTRSAVGTDLDLEALELGARVRDPAFGTPLRKSDLAIVALGLAGACGAVALVVRGGVATDTSAVEIEEVGRLSEDCEAAVYYCCLEALQNVAKHAGDDASASVQLWHDRSVVHFRVSDDGVGFVEHSTARGAGLTNMADRIEAVGGSLALRSAPGEGTTVELRLRLGVGNRTGSDVVHA